MISFLRDLSIPALIIISLFTFGSVIGVRNKVDEINSQPDRYVIYQTDDMLTDNIERRLVAIQHSLNELNASMDKKQHGIKP